MESLKSTIAFLIQILRWLVQQLCVFQANLREWWSLLMVFALKN